MTGAGPLIVGGNGIVLWYGNAVFGSDGSACLLYIGYDIATIETNIGIRRRIGGVTTTTISIWFGTDGTGIAYFSVVAHATSSWL